MKWFPGGSYCADRWDLTRTDLEQLLAPFAIPPPGADLDALLNAIKLYDLDCPSRVAGFLTQLMYDSVNFTQTSGTVTVDTMDVDWVGSIRIPEAAWVAVCKEMKNSVGSLTCTTSTMSRTSILSDVYLASAAFLSVSAKGGKTPNICLDDVREYFDIGVGTDENDVKTGYLKVMYCLYQSFYSSASLPPTDDQDPDLTDRTPIYQLIYNAVKDVQTTHIDPYGPLFFSPDPVTIDDGATVTAFSDLVEFLDLYRLVFPEVPDPQGGYNDGSVILPGVGYDEVNLIMNFPVAIKYSSSTPQIVLPAFDPKQNLANFFNQDTLPTNITLATAQKVTFQGSYDMTGNLNVRFGYIDPLVTSGQLINLPKVIRYNGNDTGFNLARPMSFHLTVEANSFDIIFDADITVNPAIGPAPCNIWEDPKEECPEGTFPLFVQAFYDAFTAAGVPFDSFEIDRGFANASTITWYRTVTKVTYLPIAGSLDDNEVGWGSGKQEDSHPKFVGFVSDTKLAGAFEAKFYSVEAKGLFGYFDWEQGRASGNVDAWTKGQFSGSFHPREINKPTYTLDELMRARFLDIQAATALEPTSVLTLDLQVTECEVHIPDVHFKLPHFSGDSFELVEIIDRKSVV